MTARTELDPTRDLATTTSPYPYRASGLDWVYLANGFTHHKTPYGPGVSIARADALHEAIALGAVTAPWRLRGQEVRYLRAMLDLSQDGLARALGTTCASVARWESARDHAIPGTADRALRLLYAVKTARRRIARRIAETPSASGRARRGRSVFRATAQGWQTEAAAA